MRCIVDHAIRILAPELINQIAAGEVVERPASVVKELAENALDAGAGKVTVDIEGGGRRLIHVVDDGCGMTPDEMRLALERHATSKITRAEDLFALRTLGFRGEALPSIAAVSRLALTSRRQDSPEACRLELEGGAPASSGVAGAAPGTSLEVRDLFFNVPARLKFLKAEGTETGHVHEAVLRLALAHPNVHFVLRSSGKALLDLPPHGSLLERARVALGRRLPAALHGHALEAAPGMNVTCCLGAPWESLSTSRSAYLFVNRRFVRDRSLLHAVVMGYGETLERGRYPMAVIHLEIPPDAVDVNVHPQKIEVRFARPDDVFAAVRRAVRDACARAPWLEAESARESLHVYSLPPPVAVTAREIGSSSSSWHEKASQRAEMQAALELFQAPQASEPAAEGVRGPGFFAALRYLGQLHKTYLLCEGVGELVLIDQHAAHERVTFERLRQAHRQRQMRTQQLLFPHTVELDGSQAAVVEDQRETLQTLGFEIEPFGGRTFAVKAVPETLVDSSVEQVVLEILEQLAAPEQDAGVAGHPSPSTEAIDHALATMACHSVIRAGDILDERRARALLDVMDGIDFRAHCPHGRPVLLRMTIAELERRFGRT